MPKKISDILQTLSPDDATVIWDALAERKQTMEKLEASEERMRIWLECSPACTKILDLDFNLLYMSHAGVAGLRIDDVTAFYGKPYPFYFFPEDAKAKMVANLERVKRTKELITKEGPVFDIHGNELWFEATIIPIFDPHNELEHLMVVSVNITERKQAEQRLAEEKERLTVTLQSIGDGVITTDKCGKVLLMNLIAEDLTGWKNKDAEGKDLETIFNIVNQETSEPVDSPMKKVFETGNIVGLANHTVLISKTGKRFHIADSAAPIRDRGHQIIGVVLVFRDVTDEFRMKEQLLQSQKMEAIGQLAGGIAHDFNNMLGGIIGATELLKYSTSDGPDSDALHEIILDSSTKATDLTSKLLAFARKQPAAAKVIDFHQVVQDAIALLEKSLDRRIIFSTRLTSSQSRLLGEPTQLQNAVMNLAINSAQAMPEGGIISLETRHVDLDERYCDHSPFALTPGPYLALEIRDTGQGIDLADLPHIFEPFFTTKQSGKGTGLGLAAVLGTIQQHKGEIIACSEPEKGSCFLIHLPITLEPIPPIGLKPLPIRGSGTILIVDDEPHILSTAKAHIEGFGYSVETAENGSVAFELFKNSPDKFDLVLLDMVMPVMSGKECFEKMIAIKPDLCVVLSSGFTHEDDLEDMRSKGLHDFLGKPYHREDLSQLLHSAMKSR